MDRSVNGIVRALFVAPEKSRHVEVPSVQVIETGFEGDFHARFASERQILLMPVSVLNELRLKPGAVFENAVIDGLDVMSLALGQHLRIGTATFEVTIPCEPCIRMERVRPGLQDALQNRRGMFVKVVSTGLVKVGDPAETIRRFP